MADEHREAASPSAGPADLLNVSQESRGGAVVVRFAGEIDLTSLGSMRAALDAALTAATAPDPVVLDLAGVGFLASGGLAELVMAHERAAGQGTPLRVVATGRAVLRPLEVTGLAATLDLRPDVTSALALPVEDIRDQQAR